jgi:hypothetical protein
LNPEKRGNMEKHGVITVDVPIFEGDYWNGYNEDCDVSFQGRVIIDSDYISDMIWVDEMDTAMDYYLCR